MKIYRLFFVCFLLAGYPSFVSGLSHAVDAGDGSHRDRPGTSVFQDKNLGVIQGTPMNTYISDLFPGIDIRQYRSTTDMLFSLHAGQLDAAITHEQHMQEIFTQNPVLLILANHVHPLPEGPSAFRIVFQDNRTAVAFGFVKEQTLPFRERFAERIYINFIEEQRYMLILNGLKVTLLISLFSAIMGTLLGGVICYAYMSDHKTLSGLARNYIAFMNVTPLLLLLLIVYYILFSGMDISTFFVAILALGLHFGAQMAELFRSAIMGIDKGQQEAAVASGFTRYQSFLHIIFPQAFHRIIPIYKSEFINLVKMTAWLGYIGIQDLTHASDIIRSRTYDAFFPLVLAAILYGMIAWLIIWLMHRVEVSADPKKRRVKLLKEVVK